MQLTNSCIIVFAKAPRPGTTKTRLIPLLGAEGAAALQARLIEHTLVTATAATRVSVRLYGTPATDEFLRNCAERHDVPLLSQSEGDLGERMRSAFDDAFAHSACVLLIGTDCPALTVRHLESASRALSQGCDAIFVPTEDGGYALIGLTRTHPELFSEISWSTSRVMEETRTRLRELEFDWRELETLWDVDRPDDYARLMDNGNLLPFQGT